MPDNSAKVFKSIETRLTAALKALPRQLGAEVVRYSDQRFREGGWDGVPWQRRKPGAKRNTGRALLINTGRLRRGTRVTAITTDSVTVGNNVPYAAIHNQGFNGIESVKAHTRKLKFKAQFTDLTEKTKRGKFKVRTAKGAYETKVKAFTRRMRMPKRQFLGDSPYLRRNLNRIITASIRTALK